MLQNLCSNMTTSNQVPPPLLDQTQCVGVVPKLTKGGFIAGGEHGDGVVSCRTDQGWSEPAFFSISAGSIGLQAGVEGSADPPADEPVKVNNSC